MGRPSRSDGGTLRWQAFAWWRVAVAVVPVAAWFWVALEASGAQSGSETAGWAFLGVILLAVPVALLAVPSLPIAIGGRRRARRAVHIALVHDALILAAVTWMAIDALRNPDGVDHASVVRYTLPWIGAGVLFGAEAAYLLRAALGWRLAWPALTVLVAGALSAVALVPPGLAARRLQHVCPLLRYADTHWFAVPPGAKITVGQWGAEKGHADAITVEGRDSWWTVQAAHDESGRWVRAGREGDPQAIPGRMGEQVRLRARTREEAMRVLEVCGVPDRAVHFEETRLNQFTRRPVYRFSSARAGGSYEVIADGQAEFLWEQPLDLH